MDSQTESDAPTGEPEDSGSARDDDASSDGVDEGNGEGGARADVTGVSVSGEPGAYTFSVALRSDETGCQQFADWWEVLDSEGNLLYRRVLLHSHVREQPFTRTGGPVDIAPETTVVVRAHMNTTGYAPQAMIMRGSPSQGFEVFAPAEGFGASAERQPPQPQDCAF